MNFADNPMERCTIPPQPSMLGASSISELSNSCNGGRLLQLDVDDDSLSSSPYQHSCSAADTSACSSPPLVQINELSLPRHVGEKSVGRGTTSYKRKGKRLYAQRRTLISTETSITTEHLAMTDASTSGSQNQYPCTVCPESFRRASDWQRHEESTHNFNSVEWTCLLHDARLVGTLCLFCSEVVSDISHFAKHNDHVCSASSVEYRTLPRKGPSKGRGRHDCANQNVADHTFVRKDFLAQHIRGIHLKSADESFRKAFKVPGTWSKEVEFEQINFDALWCGFCQQLFACIPDRMADVANHFRNGMKMEDWVFRSTE
jgi:hypothetical protein